MSNKPKPLSDTEVRNVVRTAIDEAVNYVESEISPDRERAMRYYEGKCDVGHEQGRSRIVSTKIRDTMYRSSQASCGCSCRLSIRLSLSAATRSRPKAENASEYCKIIFNKHGGYKLLGDVFHDSLLCKNGIAKVFYDPEESQEIIEYANLTDQEMGMVASNPELEVLEHITNEAVGPDGMPSATHDIKVVKTVETGEIKMESVPPEQFFIDPSASCISDAYIVGQRQEMTVGDLIALGFTWEQCEGLDSLDGRSDEEKYERIGYDDERDG